MKKSALGTWSGNDFVKGLITAVISAVLTGLVTCIQSGAFWPDAAGWKQIAGVGLIAGLGYLSKNLATNSKDQFMKSEPTPPASDNIKPSL